MAKNSNKLVFVVGMHRSLTSCVTRMVQLCLGAFVADGADLLAANGRNVPGYFESKKVFRLNELILEAGGTSWSKVRQSPLVTCVQRDRILGVVREFAKHKISVIKDPRLCVMVPYWYAAALEVYEPENIQVVYVVRAPAEVAMSLQRVWAMDLCEGLDLWRFYNARALTFLEGLGWDWALALDAGAGAGDHFNRVIGELRDRLGTTDLGMRPSNFYQAQYRHFSGGATAADFPGCADEMLALTQVYCHISESALAGQPFQVGEVALHAQDGQENDNCGGSAKQAGGTEKAPEKAGQGQEVR